MTLKRYMKVFFISSAISLLLISCKGGGDSSPIDVEPSIPEEEIAPPAEEPKTLNEVIQELENSGVIPELNQDEPLLGTDENQNGIRDDLDSWIAGIGNLTTIQKNALQQQAQALQLTLIVNITNGQSLKSTGLALADAVNCINKQFTEEGEAYRWIKMIEQMTINTKDRAIRYEEYNLSRSGSVTKLQTGDRCNVF